MYFDADIFLFDGSLSALDPHVAYHIFNSLILQHLNNKTVIFCTHSIHFLASARKSIENPLFHEL